MGRTTIEVLDKDKDNWNWIKNIRNKHEMSSVSNVVFKLIKTVRELDINKILFLKNLEKFYEYHYFGIKDLSKSLGVDIKITMKMVSTYFGPNFRLLDSKKNPNMKNREKVHKKLIEIGILPRELQIAYNLQEIIKKSNIDIEKYFSPEYVERKIGIENKEILRILFPDPQERQLEIYNYLIYFVQNFFAHNKIESIPCHKCKNQNCPMKKPDYIYFKSGIALDLEDIEGDLVFEIIEHDSGLEEKSNVMACYGAFLSVSIDFLIRDNLRQLEHFFKDDMHFSANVHDFNKFLQILKAQSKKSVIERAYEMEDKEQFEYLYEHVFHNRISGVTS